MMKHKRRQTQHDAYTLRAYIWYRRVMVLLFVLFCVVLLCGAAWAGTLRVRGNMDSLIHFTMEKQIQAADGTSEFHVSVVRPVTYSSPTFSQQVEGVRFTAVPPETMRREKTDTRGNRIVTFIWKKPPASIRFKTEFDAVNTTVLTRIDSSAPFPVRAIPREAQVYVLPSADVQSDDPLIITTARELTQGVISQYEAVRSISAWVVDRLRYVHVPPAYDATYSFTERKGNCQNYSHLAAALLRAAGIPVRIVNGFTLDAPYDITLATSVIRSRMALGRHSWIEVWFADLGWVPFNPQTTALYVPNRFIRVEVGVDNREAIADGRSRWRRKGPESPKPDIREILAVDFAHDAVGLYGREFAEGPQRRLMLPEVQTVAEAAGPVSAPALGAPSQRTVALAEPARRTNAGEGRPVPDTAPSSERAAIVPPSGSGDADMPTGKVTRENDHAAVKTRPSGDVPDSSPKPVEQVAASVSEPQVEPPSPSPASGKGGAVGKKVLQGSTVPPGDVFTGAATDSPADSELPVGSNPKDAEPPAKTPKSVLQVPMASPALPQPASQKRGGNLPAVSVPPLSIAPIPGMAFSIGNVEFPEGIDFGTWGSGAGTPDADGMQSLTRNFVVETAEYVTTKQYQYAQAVELPRSARVEQIRLALHRFGGEGMLWIDVYADAQQRNSATGTMEGRPGKLLGTTALLEAETLSLSPGYRWVAFDFPESRVFEKGRYWLALGYSGSPVVNWFFSYGKPVGPLDGTRFRDVFAHALEAAAGREKTDKEKKKTAEKGQQAWSGALAYEFVYAVDGVFK